MLDAWLQAHQAEQVRFLQALVRQPTDTPPGDNASHAELTARLLAGLGLQAEQHPVPAALVQAQGMQSITNLIVRQRFGVDSGHAGAAGPTIALNAHGDVVPPGEGWTHGPYSGDVADGRLYGRAAAVSKGDFATYTFALLALRALCAHDAALAARLAGTLELHFTYDEEFGGELGPGWLLRAGLTRPDLLIAAGFSYQVVNAHNGCLQLAVRIEGLASHAAYPQTGVDALQAATALLSALYAHNAVLRQRLSQVPGITHPYLNVGRIEGGSHTNVVPGEVLIKLDRRMIPEEDPATVEAEVRALIDDTLAALVRQQPHGQRPLRHRVQRLLLAAPLKPLAGHERLAEPLQRHGREVFGCEIPVGGTPLYTDVRLYGEHGVPAVIYGAGPRTVLESNAKRADEHLLLSDLFGATRVVARTLLDLLQRRS